MEEVKIKEQGKNSIQFTPQVRECDRAFEGFEGFQRAYKDDWVGISFKVNVS